MNAGISSIIQISSLIRSKKLGFLLQKSLYQVNSVLETMIYIFLESWWYKDETRTFPLMDGYTSIGEELTGLVGSLFNNSSQATVFHSTGELCFEISPTRHTNIIFQCTEPKAILDFETLHRTKNSLASATNTILMCSWFESRHALL